MDRTAPRYRAVPPDSFSASRSAAFLRATAPRMTATTLRTAATALLMSTAGRTTAALRTCAAGRTAATLRTHAGRRTSAPLQIDNRRRTAASLRTRTGWRTAPTRQIDNGRRTAAALGTCTALRSAALRMPTALSAAWVSARVGRRATLGGAHGLRKTGSRRSSGFIAITLLSPGDLLISRTLGTAWWRVTAPATLLAIPGPIAVVRAPIVPDAERQDWQAYHGSVTQDRHFGALIRIPEIACVDPAAHTPGADHVTPAESLGTTRHFEWRARWELGDQRIVALRASAQIHPLPALCVLRQGG